MVPCLSSLGSDQVWNCVAGDGNIEIGIWLTAQSNGPFRQDECKVRDPADCTVLWSLLIDRWRNKQSSSSSSHLTDLSNCFRSERVPVYNPGLGWEAAKYPLRAVFSLIFSLCLGCISKRGNSYIFWEPHFLNLIRSLTDICRAWLRRVASQSEV